MVIDFLDVKNIKIKSFSMYGTYDDHFEGNRQSVTKQILDRNINKKGLYYIQPELVNGALKKFVFCLTVWSDWEHRMEIIWYDDEIPTELSLLDYLQQKVKDIDFKTNCEFIDLDNF